MREQHREYEEVALCENIIADVYSDLERYGGFLEVEVVPTRQSGWRLFEQKINFMIPWDGKEKPGEVARRYFSTQDWSEHPNEYFKNVDWTNIITSGEKEDFGYRGPLVQIQQIVPDFNTPFLAKHLLPHIRQGALRAGLSLSEYADRIHDDEGFRKQEETWLKDPYYKIYKLKKGIQSHGFNEGALGCLYQHSLEMHYVEEH